MLEKYKLIPVAVFGDEKETVNKLDALRSGGLPVAEICFRTERARYCVETGVKQFPDMYIGAGTVINEEQCREAIEVGAKFIVSPGLSLPVAEYCRKKGVDYYPGVVTPTEIMSALSVGLTTLKFFPAQDFGGLKTIKALSAAFPQVKFMPTGGVSESNLIEYLSFEKIIACGGSFMMKGTADEVREKTARAVKLIKESNL